MISVIVYGRNDSHGYNLPKRAAISFNCIAEVLTNPSDEVIFVDCNTPDDMPTFPESIADTLTSKAKALLKILRVRPDQYEKGKNGTRFKVLEPLCRNVALRRSNPENRWILNTNTDMVFVPLHNASLSDVCKDLPDGFYELPRFEMPETLWESADRKDPVGIIKAFHRWGTRLHINEAVRGRAENLFDAPGDFQLALRDQMFAIQGMNEQMVHGWHVDSNLCKRLNLLNGATLSLLDKVYGYHCDHTRVNSIVHSIAEGTFNSLVEFVENVSIPDIPQQATTWGLVSEEIEEVRLTDAPSSRFIRVMESILPGMHDSMLSGASVRASWNHGLLYDTQHVLPYLADHLSVVPPHWNIGYVGANVELISKLARFRSDFGHSGKLLLCEQVLRAGNGTPHETLGTNCEFVSIDQISSRSSIICLDLWAGNLKTAINVAGYSVPAPSVEIDSFADMLMRFFLQFARQEKDKFNARTPNTKLFVLGSQNTWFEPASRELFSLVLTPYSSYVRHGFIRDDAFDKPAI